MWKPMQFVITDMLPCNANDIWKLQWEENCVHHFNDIFIFGIFIIDFLLLFSMYRKVQREHSSKFLHVKKCILGILQNIHGRKKLPVCAGFRWYEENEVNYSFNVIAITSLYANCYHLLGIFMSSKLLLVAYKEI